MRTGQFAKRHGDGVGGEGGDDIAENDAGAGDLESGGGSEKQARADGAANGDHGHLSGGELVAKAVLLDFRDNGGWRHAERYQTKLASPKWSCLRQGSRGLF